jgi:hypothetical protein
MLIAVQYSTFVCLQLTERTQRAVQRFVHFIEALPYEQVAPLLPSLADLRLRFEVSPECSLSLLRPALRRALRGWSPEDPEIDVLDKKEATETEATGAITTTLMSCAGLLIFEVR